MHRIILVGFMGSGKSSLGKKLANKLDVPFLDSDYEIERENSLTVSEIFREFGEGTFREKETEFIDRFDPQKEFVLAVGGGMPIYGDNMKKLKDLGTIIYLKRPAKELVNRLLNAKQPRPLIDGLSSEQLLEYVIKELSRREIYYNSADLVLSREEQNVESMIDVLSRHKRKRN